MSTKTENNVVALPKKAVTKISAQDFLNPPGLVGEIAEYVESTMYRKQRIFAVASALTILSTTTQGKYLVEALQTPLAIYQMLIGGTTAGKEAPRSAGISVAKEVGMIKNVFDSIASGPALISALDEMAHPGEEGDPVESGNPTLLILLDEIGMVLAQARGNSHGESFAADLMKLFGKGNGIYTGKAYAGDRKNIQAIENPYVNLMGTTTEETLIDALSHKDVVSGFLNRFMLVKAVDACPPMAMRIVKSEIPPALLDKLNRVANMGRTAGTLDIVYEDGVEQLFQNFSNEVDKLSSKDVVGGLLGRAVQNAIAVAGLLAVGDCKDLNAPVITCDHAKWGISWVKWCVNEAASLVENNVADSDDEKKRIMVLRLIQTCSNPKFVNASGAAKFKANLLVGQAPRAWLIKKAKVSAKVLNDIIETLVAGEQITSATVQDKIVYVSKV